MTKRIDSPSTKWAGHVLLHDPLTLEHVLAWDDMRDETADLPSSKYLAKLNLESKVIELPTWSSKEQKYLLPAILRIVAEWHLENFPEHPTLETFPMSPRGESTRLVNWLYAEIEKIYWGAVDVPNESWPTL